MSFFVFEIYYLIKIILNFRGEEGKDGTAPPKSKSSRPLYDIPWMFEAREYLRKNLIGQKVNVIVDYKQPAVENFPEKTCCTVMFKGKYVFWA